MGRISCRAEFLRCASIATASSSVSLPLSTKRMISRGLNMCTGVSTGVGVGTGVGGVVGNVTGETVGRVVGKITGSGVGLERSIGVGVGTKVGLGVWLFNSTDALADVGDAGGMTTGVWVGNIRLDDEFACWPVSLAISRIV